MIQIGQVPEEKLRSPIFKYTYDGKVYTPAGRPDLTFKVPKEITVTPMATHLEQTNSSLYYSYEHTVSVDIRRFSFSLGLNLGKFGFGAQYGYEYGRIKERLNVKYQASARALYLTTTYSTIALPYVISFFGILISISYLCQRMRYLKWFSSNYLQHQEHHKI
jgi:hypothetical protein